MEAKLLEVPGTRELCSSLQETDSPQQPLALPPHNGTAAMAALDRVLQHLLTANADQFYADPAGILDRYLCISTNISTLWSSLLGSLQASCQLLEQQQQLQQQPAAAEAPDHQVATIVWSVLYAVMLTVALCGNAVVIWIVLGHRHMRTNTNIFLLNMSVADFIMALLNCSFNFVFMLKNHWIFGETYCVINNVVATISVPASVFSLTALTLERYMAIVYPLRARLGRKGCCAGIAAIWMAAAMFGVPSSIYSRTVSVPYTDHLTCLVAWPDFDSVSATGSKQEYIYNVCFMFLTYLVPMVVMGFCFGAICKKLWGAKAIGEVSSGQMETLRSRERVVKMCFIVFVIFGICWLPYQFYFIYIYHHPQITVTWYVQHLFLAFYWLAMSTAMVNPIVYYWMNQRFRTYFRRVFRKVLCCGCCFDCYCRTPDSNKGFRWSERSDLTFISDLSSVRQTSTVRRSSTQTTQLKASRTAEDLEMTCHALLPPCDCQLAASAPLSPETEPASLSAWRTGRHESLQSG